MHSWAYLQRYEETANYFTKDHDRREIELSCNSAHTQAEGRNWYWWRYNRFSRSEGCTSRPLTSLMAPLFYFLPETVCTLPIVFIYPKWPAENARDGISFPDPKFEKFLGEHAPSRPPCLGRLGLANFSSPACTFKISCYTANYRHLIAYEINAQGWKKRLSLEGVGKGGGGYILKFVIVKRGGGYNFHM